MRLSKYQANMVYLFLGLVYLIYMDCSGSADEVNKYVSMMSAVAVIGILSAPPSWRHHGRAPQQRLY